MPTRIANEIPPTKPNVVVFDHTIARINGRFNELKKSFPKNKYNLIKKENFNSFDSWLQNVVWYGNKRGDYLNDFEII